MLNFLLLTVQNLQRLLIVKISLESFPHVYYGFDMYKMFNFTTVRPLCIQPHSVVQI